MDSHTLRTLDRLEIVETGRRHNISRSMLVVWRRAFKAGGSVPSMAAFVPVIAKPASSPPAVALAAGDRSARSARIEIVLTHDRRIIVDEHVDPNALSRVLDVLDRR